MDQEQKRLFDEKWKLVKSIKDIPPVDPARSTISLSVWVEQNMQKENKDKRIEELEFILKQFLNCARYTPNMGGPSIFSGWKQSELREVELRARELLNIKI